MKYKHILSDRKNRIKFASFEIKSLVLKAILFSITCKKSKFLFQQIISFFGTYSGVVKIHNRCFLTGRGHSVDSFSGISRIEFREKTSLGELVHIKKKSW